MNEMDRLKNAFIPASADFHNHVTHTLDHMEALTMKKTSMRISAVAIALIILLVAGIALAAAHFGVLDYISYHDDEGNALVNENVIPHIQPIDVSDHGEVANLTIHDAICDGTTLSMAWTLENTLPDEDVFVIWYPVIENGEILQGAGTISRNEFLLKGGETWQGGFSSELDPLPEGDNLHVNLHISLLTPLMEIVALDDPTDATTEADASLLPELDYQENERVDEALVRLGYMRQVEVFDIPLTLDITSGMKSILPYVDQTTNEMDNYRMTLTSIERSPTMLRYTIDYSFDDEVCMGAFVKERAAIALWPIEDETNKWYGSAGTSDPEKLQNTDGTWTLRYTCNITEIWRMPESFDIVAHNVMTNEVYNTGERFHVSIPQE